MKPKDRDQFGHLETPGASMTPAPVDLDNEEANSDGESTDGINFSESGGVSEDYFPDENDDGEGDDPDPDSDPANGEGDNVVAVPLKTSVQTLNQKKSQQSQRREKKNNPNKSSSPMARLPGRPRKQPVDDGVQAIRKGPGRPRIHPLPGGDDDGMRAVESFPKPNRFHFRDENLDNSGKPNGFFRYWRTVYENLDFRDRLVVYVYRNWPVLKEGRRQLDKMGSPIALDDLQLRYGAGDYHLKMNDAGMKYKTIAICTVKGLRNEQEHPPVFELDALEMEDPLNKSFIERLRTKGIRLPGDQGYVGPKEKERKEGDDEDMAQLQMLKTYTESIERATDRTIELATRNAAPSRDDEEDTSLRKSGVSIMEQAIAANNRILEAAITKAQAIAAPAAGAAPAQAQANPLDTLSALITMMDKLRPPQADTDKTMVAIQNMSTQMLEQERDFHKQLFSMQADRIKGLEDLVRNNANTATTTAVALQPKGLVEQLKELSEAKEMIREALGLEDSGGGGSSWVEHLPTIIQGLGLLGSVVVSGLHNLAVLKTGAGTPIPPPGPDQILTPEQQDAVRAAGFSQQPTPGNPGMNPPVNQPQPGEQNMNPFVPYHSFVEQLRPSMLKAFNEGLSGDEYAETLIELGDNGLFGPNTSGRQTYDTLLEKGQELIHALIRSYPPVWNVVSQTPKKWEKFLTDFFHADDIYTAKQSQAQAQARAQSQTGQTNQPEIQVIDPVTGLPIRPRSVTID